MECPYIDAWEVIDPLPIDMFCELLIGLLPLADFEYEMDADYEWGISIVEGTPFEIFVQRLCENSEPSLGEPFTIMLIAHHERQEEFPITAELREQTKPWVIKINQVMDKMGYGEGLSYLQEASQTSLSFWNNSEDDAAWNSI